MKVIAISGKKGTGKDWKAAQLFAENPTKTIILAFADPLKAHLFAIGFTDVLSADKSIITRQKLIRTGTQMRKTYGDAYFANQILAQIEIQKSKGIERVIISDLRFRVELYALQSDEAHGHFQLELLRMHAPKRNQLRIEKEANGNTALAEQLANDISETDLDTIVENGSIFKIIHNDL